MKALRKIIVTGANGQLGNELRDLSASYPGYHFDFFDREGFPVENRDEVFRIIGSVKPDFVLNCAAYTAVDKAESEQQIAAAVNGAGPGYIAAACKSVGAKLMHISTDYVFNGTATEPLKETDPVEPVNQYGEGKLEGEKNVMEQDPGSIIIRTAWVYSAYGKNFVKTMLRLMNERDSVSVVADQVGSPTYAGDLAAAMMQIVDSDKWKGGIYHYSNQGVISWYDLAVEIRNLSGSTCEVKPITTDQYPTPAKRPQYSVLDTSKIRESFGITIPAWKESLELCLQRLKNKTI
jgi:dTDP-4-dehydrorhamnose reductase